MFKCVVIAAAVGLAATTGGAMASTVVGGGGTVPVSPSGAQTASTGLPIGVSLSLSTNPADPLPICVAPDVHQKDGQPLFDQPICIGGGTPTPNPTPLINLHEQSNLASPLPICVHPYIAERGKPPIIDTTICIPPQ